MCFSATASFTLSGILGAVGVASISQCALPRTKLFAGIPLLFGLQQFCEGVVWATMDAPAHVALHESAIVGFLALALVIWPLWAPLSLWLIEPSGVRRRIQQSFFIVGLMVAAVALHLLLKWEPYAVVKGRSIDYQHATMGVSIPEWGLLLAYALPTVASFFVSTAKMVSTIGVMLAGSLVVAFVIKHEALTSVWCFFAAALSVMIYVAVTRMDREPATSRASEPELAM